MAFFFELALMKYQERILDFNYSSAGDTCFKMVQFLTFCMKRLLFYSILNKFSLFKGVVISLRSKALISKFLRCFSSIEEFWFSSFKCHCLFTKFLNGTIKFKADFHSPSSPSFKTNHFQHCA